MKKKLIILINPIKLHETFCQKVIKAGFNLIACHTFTPNNYLSIDPCYFDHIQKLTFNLESDLKEIHNLIKNHHLICVIPGFETDFEYSEKVAYALCPEAANNPNNSFLRFDKFEMNQALKAADLYSIPQVLISANNYANLEEINQLKFPVIVKPSFEAAGSLGVKSCRDYNEVKSHIEQLQNNFCLNSSPKKINIVVQEQIEGVEYFVDSVSMAGKHYIVAIYKYEKIRLNGLVIYRYGEIVSFNEPQKEICYDFGLKVLDTLKLKFGFAHTEFMVNSINEPYLMELNPRLSGLAGQFNKLSQDILGYDQTDVFLCLLQNQDLNDVLLNRKQKSKKHGRVIFLFAWQEKIFNGFNKRILEKIKSNQVYFHLFKQEGDCLEPPKSLLDIVMTITLVDEEMANIIADTNYLQELEEEGKLFND